MAHVWAFTGVIAASAVYFNYANVRNRILGLGYTSVGVFIWLLYALAYFSRLRDDGLLAADIPTEVILFRVASASRLWPCLHWRPGLWQWPGTGDETGPNKMSIRTRKWIIVLGIVSFMLGVPMVAYRYLPEQEDSFFTLYKDNCAICHGENLEGSPARTCTGRWRSQSWRLGRRHQSGYCRGLSIPEACRPGRMC